MLTTMNGTSHTTREAQCFAAEDQMRIIQEYAQMLRNSEGFVASDADFLTAAVQEIADSRRFLKWTYAFAFFTNLDPQQRQFFEFHQGQLESTLEQLSDKTENTDWGCFVDSRSWIPFSNVRFQLVSLTSVVHNFFSALSDAMEHGTLFSS